MADPTPEQRVAEATSISDRSHMSGVTVDDTVECDSCGEQFPHWARWLGHREQARANAALDAVRDALASDDPAVVRAMAERVGLVDLHPGESVMWRANQRRHILATPWREVPDE